MKKLVICAAAVVALTGCDIASEVAGDAIAGEIRTRYIEQCEGIAEGAGIAAERIGAACECSADNLKEDFAADGQLDINRERVEELLSICIQDDAEVAPAEG